MLTANPTETFIPDALTVWTLNAITQLLLQKRFTDSSLFLLSTMSANSRAVRHIVHGWVTLVFYVDGVEKEKLTWAECVFVNNPVC